MNATREIHLDRLLGREVLGRNGQRMGRLEEFHAERRGAGCVIVGFAIGVAGLLERMNLSVKMILGLRGGGYVARWDQIDLSDPDRPRLTCAVEELQKT
jgi:hypothetical protein